MKARSRESLKSVASSSKSEENEIAKVTGICSGNGILRSRNMKIQLIKMLCLILLPILGIWCYTIFQMVENILAQEENIKTRSALQYSIEMGKLVHHVQKERDMSILYLSALGPETKSFLLSEYIETDRAIKELTKWPTKLGRYDAEHFESKNKLQQHIASRRQRLNPAQNTIDDELKFYSEITNALVYWLYDAIKESKFAFTWKAFVAYQKVTIAKESAGVERALGTMFYARGGFSDHKYLENFNFEVSTFKTFYKSARIYSSDVTYLYQYANTPDDQLNVSDVINIYREEIQHFIIGTNLTLVNLREARMWFDNMTVILDILLSLQTNLADVALHKLNIIIESKQRDIVIFVVCLVVVILMCPLIIFFTETLTSGIQQFANILVDKTKELKIEKKRTDSLLYQMVPKKVAERLKKRIHTDAEYYKSVTIFFSDVYGFTRITKNFSPMEVIKLLNNLYELIDDMLDNYDVYKVETINDCYMVASGLPNRTRNKHATEIANFALDILKMMQLKQYSIGGPDGVTLRIGINTGSCMAGVIGAVMPRYCLFGDTINTASRMKSHSKPDRINISHTTCSLLKKTGQYIIKKRGLITVKGKGDMLTYWLKGKRTLHRDTKYVEEEISTDDEASDSDLPGEITQYQDPHLRSILSVSKPGKNTASRGKQGKEMVTARVRPNSLSGEPPAIQMSELPTSADRQNVTKTKEEKM